MKPILLLGTILILIFPTTGNCFTIHGRIINNAEKKFEYSSVMLFQNGEIIEEVKSEGRKGFRFVGLENGEYLLRYTNRFYQYFDTLIVIEGKSIRNLFLKYSSFVYLDSLTFLDRMEPNDTLELIQNIWGCRIQHDTLRIIKIEEEYYVSLNGASRYLLSPTELFNLKNYEKQFRQLHYVHNLSATEFTCLNFGIGTAGHTIRWNNKIFSFNVCDNFSFWNSYNELTSMIK